MRIVDLIKFALFHRRKSINRLVLLALLSAGIGLLSLLSPAIAKPNANAMSQAESPLAERPANPAEQRFNDGVKAYRTGDYGLADKLFDALHKQFVENTKFTYYLAITEAQLGRFQHAKQLYGEIVTLDPNGEAATLAKEGLQYLPPEASIDPPPRFNQMTSLSAAPSANNTVIQPDTTQNPKANSSVTGAMTPSGISPQDLMAWQMLMGQNNGSNNNNPMGMFMPGMMGLPNGTNGNTPFDPNIMSTMLMNQMMQNMNLSGEQGENR